MNPHYREARFLASPPTGGWPDRFGVVTAWNPMDRPSTAADNAAAHARLVAKVQATPGLLSFPVTGGSADMQHQEPGLGLTFQSEDEAVSWGREFEQRAVFWIERGTLWLVPCGVDGRESLGPWQDRVLPPAPQEG